MITKYDVDFRSSTGQLISTRGMFDTLQEARECMERWSTEEEISIGYQDGRSGYLEIIFMGYEESV